MRTYPLYDPKVYSILIFRPKEEQEDKTLETLKAEFQNQKEAKIDITLRDDWCVIDISMEVSPGAKEAVEVSPDLIKVKIADIHEIKKKVVEKIQPFKTEGGEINHYDLVTCGSNEKIWMKTYSDISFLYKERKHEERLDLLQSNISYLNRILNRTGEVAVNSIHHGKLSSSIYILGDPQGRAQSMFPRIMILEMDMGDIRSISSYGESPIEVSPSTPYGVGDPKEKKQYQMRQNYLINLMAVKSKLMELFLIQSQYTEMKENNLKELFSNGRTLKDQIFQLQNNINNHMQLYIPKDKEKSKKGKDKDFLDRESFETEKALLTRASVHFSRVSEVEHKIMRLSSSIQDIVQKIDDISDSLNLKAETVSLEGSSQSVGDVTKRKIESSSRELSNLLDELSHSRDILSSTIEVLRTFIDTRQREVSEEMSRLMNVLFLVFACIGLADALGNFVIMGIEYIYFSDGTTVGEVLQWSSFGLLLTLLPLLIAVIFLVMFFKKKR